MPERFRTETLELAGVAACSLRDDASDLKATWLPGGGMLGVSFIDRGDELLGQGSGPGGYLHDGAFMGIPFLHPWANRLAGFSYRLGGHEVVLDRSSSLLKLDQNGLPIHGVLTGSRDWSLRELGGSQDRAHATASLEFDGPQLLAAFPFPHRVEMSVSLGDGGIEVRTTLSATSDQAVPVSFGFHPYFELPGLPRDQWEVSFPVTRHLLLDERMIPTGQTEPTEPLTGPIGDRTWDDGYDQIGPSRRFELHGGGRTLAVEFGEGFPVAQIFAPPGENYVCIEPMTAPANALNGPEDALTWVPPGESWSAAFRISAASESAAA